MASLKETFDQHKGLFIGGGIAAVAGVAFFALKAKKSTASSSTTLNTALATQVQTLDTEYQQALLARLTTEENGYGVGETYTQGGYRRTWTWTRTRKTTGTTTTELTTIQKEIKTIQGRLSAGTTTKTTNTTTPTKGFPAGTKVTITNGLDRSTGVAPLTGTAVTSKSVGIESPATTFAITGAGVKGASPSYVTYYQNPHNA
jgi:hypothetical protein